MVNINQLRWKYKEYNLDSTLILSKLLDKDKSYIYAFGDEEVSEDVGNTFIELMEKRKAGYPLQYILGEWEFMGLDFYLEEGVLIPRPETEILIEYIIEEINNRYEGKDINILEIGIGSGAISLSIANYCQNALLYGVDISPIAIKVGNINKERLKLSNVNFYLGDLFQGISELKMEEKFHIIVSNPPYIARDEIDTLQKEVKDHEPRIALDGGIDGLDFYRRITKESKIYLAEGGLLIYEIGYKQGEDVKAILEEEGFRHIELLKDFQGLDRVVMGRRK